MMLNTLRRFAPSFAALALVVAPLGCSSDTPPQPMVETSPNPKPVLDKIEGDVDHDVREAKHDAKQEGNDIKRALKETETEARHDLKATEEDLKKSAEKAVDNLLGDPK